MQPRHNVLAQVEQSEGRGQQKDQHTEENDENLAREQALDKWSVVVVLNENYGEERRDIFRACHQVVEADFSVHERHVKCYH